MRITYVGHATVLVEVGAARILTDPLLDDWVGPLRRGPERPDPGTSASLDAVLLSHMHHDHVHLPSLTRAAAGGAAVLAPGGAGEWLRAQGIDRVSEMSPGDELELAGIRVRATPALHSGNRPPLGPEAETLGYLIGNVYFAGDTDLFDGMSDLAPDVDVALLPVWGWGPTLGEGHMNPERAAEALVLLEPRVAIPIHWGTMHLPGLGGRLADIGPGWRGDYLTGPPREFAERAASVAPAVDVRVLEPGESVEL